MSARPTEHLYEQDFFAWTQLQARELRRFGRTRPNLPLDFEHLAEEVADLAVYLAGAAGTTGQIHVIDGGWTI